MSRPGLLSLAGRTALVTGASSGFGEHFARVLAAAGATVVIAARRVDRLEMLKAELVSTGARVVAAPMDVTSVASIRSAFDAVEAELGAGAVCDIVVNNAGIAEPKLSLQVTEEDWDGVVDTNLRGAFFVAQEGAKRMVAAGVGGSIINIASILGLRPGTSQANYGAAKAGLVHVTKVGWWGLIILLLLQPT